MCICVEQPHECIEIYTFGGICLNGGNGIHTGLKIPRV